MTTKIGNTPEALTAFIALMNGNVEGFNAWRDANPDVKLNLSGAKLTYTNMSNVNLSGFNMFGANLHGSVLHSADLSDTNLFHASLKSTCLSDANLSGANLFGANLHGADLSGADLSGADLSGADLGYGDLDGAKLRDANLSWLNLPVGIPIIPDIHKKIHEAASAPGAFNTDAWHTDDTTHSRAGWAIMLAGKAGKKLEFEVGTNVAAALIYMASDPDLERVPDWNASDEEARKDMKRLADIE